MEIKEIQKRDYLSITPKVEDIKVVYKWIETFNVPHFYFQVFFDKVYGISFEFLKKMGVEDVKKLPDYATLSVDARIGSVVGESL